MKKLNALIYVALAIHLILLLLIGIEGSDDEDVIKFLAIFISIPVSINCIGFCLLQFTSNSKLGAKIFMYSSYVFVPIGLIGVTGAKKILDDINKKSMTNENL
ncbi:hypothetical protein [uncultured Marixanthomonas sp.]|uniref:hypothetical protein n=1 Tax=uncultured Marixanthomonas sp. TaxID=757245 RepID=UPI0030D8757F|tara:strand:- start:67248 stop:67556 length:309 start_codon:yes stop_codon:yes gene_type:complete